MTSRELEIGLLYKSRKVEWEVLNKTTSAVYGKHVAVVLMSGGIESTTLVAWLKRRKYDVVGLFIDYGQPWMTEELATINVARHMNVQLVKFKMSALPGLQSKTDSKYSIGFIAMRNPIFISIAMNFADAHGYELVAHGAELSIHPDCSPEFAARFNFMVEAAMGNETDLPLMTPFIEMTKSNVMRIAKDLHAPLHLSWSCMVNDETKPQDFRYDADAIQSDSWIVPSGCGKCPSCEWRLESFRLANLLDPAPYIVDTTSQQRKGARPFPYYSSDQWLREVDRSFTRIK